MAGTEDVIGSQYGNHHVLDDIRAGLKRAGFDRSRLSPADLKSLDEFHTGGVAATLAILEQITITPDMRVLDIGTGIGGTARLIAERFGGHVTGVDMTPEYVETANYLSRAVALEDRLEFVVGDATDLPVDADSFDLAVMFHVGMNVADKDAVFRSVSRCLRSGGHFAIFDVMCDHNEMHLQFPLPWATRPESSFVERPEVYFDAAEAAGFRLLAERNRAAFALAHFRALMKKTEREGLPVLGLHLLMGETASEKVANYVSALEAEMVAPREMIFERI